MWGFSLRDLKVSLSRASGLLFKNFNRSDCNRYRGFQTLGALCRSFPNEDYSIVVSILGLPVHGNSHMFVYMLNDRPFSKRVA